jgi:hypothetical protein
MTQRYMAPFGTEELTLPVGHVLAAQSRGQMKIYRQVNFSNYPSTWVEIASGSNTELSVGPFAGLTRVKLEGGAHQTMFNTGAAPRAADTLGGTDPTLNRVLYFSHFPTYTAAEWVVTAPNSGTAAMTDRHGGWLLLTTGAADTNNVALQTTGEIIRFAPGRKTWFEIRLEAADATGPGITAGLQIRDTSPLDVTDGVFFIKAKGSTSVSFLVEKASTATTIADVATMANDVPIILGFYYDGANVMEYRVNRQKVGTAAVTNLPDTEELCVSFGIENGSAAAKTLRVDYVRAEAEV